MQDTQPKMIQALLRPDAYSHPVENVRLFETHISWVVLTGKDVYKIKKPIDFGFVNFTTLEQRRHFCQEELRLNRRFSNDLYLDVVPIAGPPQAPRVGGTGTPIEFAVHLRQFEQEQLLSEQLKAGTLTRQHLSDLADSLFRILKPSATEPPNPEWGTPSTIWKVVDDNFRVLLRRSDDKSQQLKDLQEWSASRFETLRETFERRRIEHLRECHGDLHLGNIILWNGRATPFDCIEFNAAFRWIDTVNEIAFLIMDLDDHQRPDLASHFLNAWLEASRDDSGLAVLSFYLTYRALVRAKVAQLRSEQPHLEEVERQQLISERRSYIELASSYQRSTPPTLFITHGVSGSGKTYGTQSHIESIRAIRIRSDVERKRLFGLRPDERSPASAVMKEMYSSQSTNRTYARLAELAKEILTTGFSVIVDATFLKAAQRQMFRDLAAELKVPFRILSFDADESVLRERVKRRAREQSDASDATISVLERQLREREPLSQAELAECHR